MKNKKKILLPVGLAALVVLIGLVVLLAVILPARSASQPVLVSSASIHVNPIPGLSPDFIMGADISMLAQIEASGGKYYVNGVERDPLQILKDHGVNWIRLRIWNDPTDANGQGLGGGNDDLAKTEAIASKAKAMGFKFELDFHYSDWWADPSKQNIPKAWVGMNHTQLKQAVYDYTAKVIQQLAKAGAMPDMVQIGNELNDGMLWPDGKITAEGTTPVGGFDGLADLLKEGIQAVRENDPNKNNPAKRVKIMIHLANGGDNNLYRTFFDAMTARNVDYDVIGLSYYSYWHGPIAPLISNMNDISQRYHKDVVIAETAYANTLSDADSTKNLFGQGEQDLGGYIASIQGQATAIRDVMAAVAQVPNGRGLGIFYWEPDWIPVPGAGWETGQGDTWDNQAMFDAKGNALPSLNVFNLVRPKSGRVVIPATMFEVYDTELETPLGEAPDLPATVKASYSDDSVRDVSVTWEPIDPAKLQTAGMISVKGKLAGSDLIAYANIKVGSQKNFAANPGFESGDLSSWTVDGSKSAVDISSEAANIHSGAHAMHYWLNGPFAFTVSQTVTGLVNGSYTLSAWIQGGGGEQTLQLFATGCGGAPQTVDIANTGWQQWSNPTIGNIPVSGGACTIGLKVASSGGSWAFFDDVVFAQNK